MHAANDGGTFALEKSSYSFSSQNGSHNDDKVPLTYRRSHCMSPVDVILSRRSIRRYEQKEIPKHVLDKILEAGRQAPPRRIDNRGTSLL